MMLSFEEAKTVLNKGLEAMCLNTGEDYQGFHVREAWELPDAFVFGGFGRLFHILHYKVLKIERDPENPLSPIPLRPLWIPGGKEKMKSLLANARRIL